MKQDKNKRWPIVFLTVLSLGIGFFFLALSPDFPVGGDAITEYHPIAKNLADGVGFWNNGEPTARVAPGYFFAFIGI